MAAKVIVIDDKPFIRRSLVETIDWAALDCEMAGSAADGIAGQRLIEELRPDLIITDIRMPGLDGLQLAEFAAELLPSCRIIVITGYEEFDYARRCLRLGVAEYILKPIDHEEVEAAVTKAVRELAAEQRKQREDEWLLPSARKQYISDVLTGRVSVPDSLERFGMHRLEASRYALLIVGDGAATPWESVEAPEGLARLNEAIYALLQPWQEEDDPELFRIDLLNQTVFVFMYRNLRQQSDIRTHMDSLAHALDRLLDEAPYHGFYYAWSEPVRQLDQLRLQFLETGRRLRLRFFEAAEPLDADHVKLSILHELEQFQTQLAAGTQAELEERVGAVLARIAAYARGNVSVAKGLIGELSLTIVRHYYKKTNSDAAFGQSVDEILNRVQRLGDMAQAESYLRELLAACHEQLDAGRPAYSSLVKEVLHYIEAHYAEDLGLKVIAERFQISSGHLSRILRKETGSGFVDIVTRTRLEAAKRLLRDPARRIYEVSELTGFKNYIYFYQVFKKYEHLSPQEYKNNHG
ncbi:response regulator [Paenibacillus sp. IB182496]|uniref:Response regulator n=1 Tax=Paenibacillus sabuli TaxID=2772509 RepID=A0A927BW86_9BACL|nr:response regulator [Paenibacillus sabuli]MBD2847056.1 response regulator [Paenibacillus sabuli]